MTDLLKKAYDPELFRKEGHKIVDLLADYLKNCFQREENLQVLPWKEPQKMLDFLSEKNDNILPDISGFIKEIMDKSIHLHHPRCMGHQVTPPLPLAALTEMVTALLNNSMAIYEVGPYSTAVEKYITDWVCSIFGYGKTSNGILTSGGSIGNLTALLAARQKYPDSDVWKDGNSSSMAVLVSSSSHYSIERAVKIMGLGDEGIIKIPVNDRFEINPEGLRKYYQVARKEGKKVIAVVANACSTSTGSYDPLDEIGCFCKQNNLWFHVDAAHGGGAVLTGKYKHLVKGIKEADSIVVDFHKMFMFPALTTAVVFKKGNYSYETFSQKASYLLDDKKENWFDVAKRTLECTKKMMGVKIYLVLKYFGVELFSDYITKTYDLGKTFARIIKDNKDFELALEPHSNIVCFRYHPFGSDNLILDQINQKIRRILKEEGEFYIVQTKIKKRVFLRVTLMNPFTTEKDLINLLLKIKNLKKQ